MPISAPAIKLFGLPEMSTALRMPSSFSIRSIACMSCRDTVAFSVFSCNALLLYFPLYMPHIVSVSRSNSKRKEYAVHQLLNEYPIPLFIREKRRERLWHSQLLFQKEVHSTERRNERTLRDACARADIFT